MHHVNRRTVVHPNRSLDRSLAFSASISRSRAGACVCSEVSRRRAEAVTSATARSNASALPCEGLLKPDSFLTNCSAEAWISSSVAGGSKLNSVLMLRHIYFLLVHPTWGPLRRPNDPLKAKPTSRTYFGIEWAPGLPRRWPAAGKASEFAMTRVTYKIVQHDGGWAYTVNGVFSEAFATHAAALAAAKRAASEQRVPGRTEAIEYETPDVKWHIETASGGDRPATDVEDT